MSPSANIVLLALAILKTPVSVQELAKTEKLEEVRVRNVLEHLLEQKAVVEVEEDKFLITDDGQLMAWHVATEDM